ncbi:maleylpyruvate isomerase family mycothiol-dependent enzyme [Kitasatospora sp. NPDC004289]
MNDFGTAERIAQIKAASDRLGALIAELTDEQAREATELPEWTRGHILAHLAGMGPAFARQAEYALRGEQIAVYDRGPASRNGLIEANHDKPAQWLRDAFAQGSETLFAAWEKLGEDDWQLPSPYRGSLLATQLSYWREVELHAVDLGLGYRIDAVTDELADHLLQFLAVRLPAGVAAVPGDGGPAIGDPQATVTVRGTRRELAGWLSGRPAATAPTADGSAVLPEIGDWP